MYVIYKIVWQNQVIYIGSTCNFNRRINEHKSKCYNEISNRYNTPIYQFIRDNCKWEDLSFEIIEEIECNDKKELYEKEGKHIRMFQSTCLNIQIAGVNCIENMKKYQKEYQKEYQKTDEYKKYQKEYRLKKKLSNSL